MRTRVFAAALAAFVIPLLIAHPAQARKKHHRRVATEVVYSTTPNRNGEYLPIGQVHESKRLARGRVALGNCPRNLGCGCNLANYYHIMGKEWRALWVARNWVRVGSPAHKGCTNCVAVLTRRGGGHVGIVKDYDANGNPIIYSYANGRLGWTTATYSSRRVIAYRSL